MRLNTFLDVVTDDNDIVAIGTENGSCFVYFGEAGNRELINKAFCDISGFPRTDVLNREIKKYYSKEVDNCIAIIVEGNEIGKIWMKKEFDKKYRKFIS